MYRAPTKADKMRRCQRTKLRSLGMNWGRILRTRKDGELGAAVLLVQNKCQQRLVYLDFAVVVFDEAEFSKFVHEEIHA